jgi:hypothetical protein
MLKINQDNQDSESEKIFKFQRSSSENLFYEIKSKINEMRVTHSSEDNLLFANNNGISQLNSKSILFKIQPHASASPNLFTLQVEKEELYLTNNEIDANDEEDASLVIEKLEGKINEKQIFQIERLEITNILVSDEIKKTLNQKLNSNLFTLQSFIYDQNIFVQQTGLALLKVGNSYPTAFEFVKCNDFYKIKLFSLVKSSEKYLVKNSNTNELHIKETRRTIPLLFKIDFMNFNHNMISLKCGDKYLRLHEKKENEYCLVADSDHIDEFEMFRISSYNNAQTKD